jgi:hypothetical protein
MDATIEENGQLPLPAADSVALGCAVAAPAFATISGIGHSAASFNVPRVNSNASGAVVRPPIFTPSACTICVSPGFVTIENRALHLGQRNSTPNEPSPGFSTFWNNMNASQLRHTNFITSLLAGAYAIRPYRTMNAGDAAG